MVKNPFKNLIRNSKIYCLDIWYSGFGCSANNIPFKKDHELTLTYLRQGQIWTSLQKKADVIYWNKPTANDDNDKKIIII